MEHEGHRRAGRDAPKARASRRREQAESKTDGKGEGRRQVMAKKQREADAGAETETWSRDNDSAPGSAAVNLTELVWSTACAEWCPSSLGPWAACV